MKRLPLKTLQHSELILWWNTPHASHHLHTPGNWVHMGSCLQCVEVAFDFDDTLLQMTVFSRTENILTAKVCSSDMLILWHTAWWGSQHFLQDGNSDCSCFWWTLRGLWFPKVRVGQEAVTPCTQVWRGGKGSRSHSWCYSPIPVSAWCSQGGCCKHTEAERGWGCLSEQEAAVLCFQGGHFCSASLSLILPICYAMLICSEWCHETSLMYMKFFDAWQLYMKNKTIRACFHLYHFYLDISSYLVLLNDIIKKKNHFIYSVAHAWDILSSGLVSLFCAFFGGGEEGGVWPI